MRFPFRAITLVQILKDSHLFAGSRREKKLKLHHLAFFGGSIFSILSKALIRLCTWAAFAVCVLKRSAHEE